MYSGALPASWHTTATKHAKKPIGRSTRRTAKRMLRTQHDILKKGKEETSRVSIVTWVVLKMQHVQYHAARLAISTYTAVILLQNYLGMKGYFRCLCFGWICVSFARCIPFCGVPLGCTCSFRNVPCENKMVGWCPHHPSILAPHYTNFWPMSFPHWSVGSLFGLQYFISNPKLLCFSGPLSVGCLSTKCPEILSRTMHA